MEQPRLDARPRLNAALFHGAWVIILLVAAWQRFSPPLQPLAHNDIWGFLSPGLQSLVGHGFQHAHGRNFLYPGLIYGLLAVFQDFRAITIFQHLLGLGAGVLLLATWCQAPRCVPQARLSPRAFDLAGLFIMAVYLFEAEPRHFEYLIRPDVVCPFFAMLALYAMVRFLIARKIDANPGETFLWGAFALFLAVFIPNLKPSFWLTSVFFTIPVWLALFDTKVPLVRRLLMVALPIGAAALLISLPERHFASKDLENETFLPESIFSIHALIIREQIADDAARQDPSVPYSQDKLRSVLTALDTGIAESKAKGRPHFKSLGYDADYLLYATPFFDDMARAEGYQWDSVLRFYNYYYFRTWRKRPGEMLGKVWSQLRLFYNSDCPAYCEKDFDLKRSYERSQLVLTDPVGQKALGDWPPALRWKESNSLLITTAPMIEMNGALRATIKLLSHAYLPALLLFLASFPLVLLKDEWRARFGPLCAVLAVGHGFNLGNNLGTAVLHTLDVNRYVYVQFATTMWTEMLTFVLLGEILVVMLDARRRKNEAGGSKTHLPPGLVAE